MEPEWYQSYIHVPSNTEFWRTPILHPCYFESKIFVPFFFVPDRALNPQPLDRTVIRSTYQNNTVATRKTHLNLVGIYYCRNRSRKIDSLMPGIPSYAASIRMFDPMNPLILIPVTHWTQSWFLLPTELILILMYTCTQVFLVLLYLFSNW